LLVKVIGAPLAFMLTVNEALTRKATPVMMAAPRAG